jgi:DNA-binding transcriptional LysR family regulator
MKGSLLELEAVVTVARRGGFRAAARELEMSSSALSHAIAALETRLGVRLFNRTTRSVALSDAGEAFVADVAPALAAIRAAAERLDEHRAEPSGTLRLNTSLGFARVILKPLVFEFMRRHPTVNVEIVTEGALVDIVGQGFDAGVRLGETVPPDMIALPLTRDIRQLVAGSPAYFAAQGRPRAPADLASHRCIRGRMANGAVYRWEFERRGERIVIDPPGTLTLDEGDLMLAAALESQGLVYVFDQALAEHLASGRLLAVLQDWSPPFPGLTLYYPSRRNAPARLRAFIELAREARRADRV